MPSKRIAIVMLVALCLQVLGVRALAAAEGDLKGHVVRSRDSQPIPAAAVQIKETGARTTTDAQGAYAFEDLAAGLYTVIVTPPSGSVMQHRVTITKGKTTSVGRHRSAVQASWTRSVMMRSPGAREQSSVTFHRSLQTRIG